MPSAEEAAAIIAEISAQGWLQGDIVPANALAGSVPPEVLDVQAGGASHFILISHSCTVHARTYDDAPLVEWIACKLVKKAPYGKLLNALNPRKLQLPLAQRLYLDLKIQRRVWTPRSLLARLERAPDVVLDAEMRGTLAYWLAHGYTRIAMPDSLVERLKRTDEQGRYIGLGVQVDNFLEANAQLLSSAWVSFSPKDELDDLAVPYTIAFRFLVKPSAKRAVDDLQAQLVEAIGGHPDLGPGLVFDGADVTPLEDFTMLDAEDFVRYNIHDWLSLGEEDVDEDEHEGE